MEPLIVARASSFDIYGGREKEGERVYGLYVFNVLASKVTERRF